MLKEIFLQTFFQISVDLPTSYAVSVLARFMCGVLLLDCLPCYWCLLNWNLTDLLQHGAITS